MDRKMIYAVIIGTIGGLFARFLIDVTFKYMCM